MTSPLGRAAMLVIGLLALAGPGIALAGSSGPRPLAVAAPGTSQLSREPVAQAYLDLVAPTNRMARAGSAFHERAWGSRDPVLIEQDMRNWVGVRKAFVRNLRRAGFFPADLRPRVEAVISATERQIHVYGQGIASLETGRGLSVAGQDAMCAADDEEDAAVGLLRADLGLPEGAPLIGGSTGLEVEEPFYLGETLGPLLFLVACAPFGLILLLIGLRRRRRARVS